jgi:hypothetical protein
MDIALGYRIIQLKDRIVEHFGSEDWREVGLLTGTLPIIDGHYRLLRSLSFGDDDYPGNALDVLQEIAETHPQAVPIIEAFTEKKYPGESEFISAKSAPRKITFAPHVFEVPDTHVELDLVAVMMPFAKEFDDTFNAVRAACDGLGLRAQRADDLWEDSVIVQDIFNLIFRAQAVLVDFTGRNPNVMYETGIAHTLGKHVVPITQSIEDVAFDLSHHRVLKYLPNAEGYSNLTLRLRPRLKQLTVGVSPKAANSSSDDDLPV